MSDKENVIYELIDEVVKIKDFDKIIQYLDSKFKLITDEDTNEAYYESLTKTYLLNSKLLIKCSWSKDIFGSTWSDGSSISIKRNDIKNSYVVLYEDDCTSGCTVRSKKVIDEGDKAKAIKMYSETIHMKNSLEELKTFIENPDKLPYEYDIDDELIKYWKALIIDEPSLKDDVEVLSLILPSFYEVAADNRSELIAYEEISPYGGEDVHVPYSNGTEFMSLIESHDIDLTNKEIYRAALVTLIEKNSKDAYLLDIRAEYHIANKLVNEITENRNNVYAYLKESFQRSYLEYELLSKSCVLEDIQSIIENQLPLLADNTSEIIILKNKSYGILKRLFQKKTLIAEKERLRELNKLNEIISDILKSKYSEKASLEIEISKIDKKINELNENLFPLEYKHIIEEYRKEDYGEEDYGEEDYGEDAEFPSYTQVPNLTLAKKYKAYIQEDVLEEKLNDIINTRLKEGIDTINEYKDVFELIGFC